MVAAQSGEFKHRDKQETVEAVVKVKVPSKLKNFAWCLVRNSIHACLVRHHRNMIESSLVLSAMQLRIHGS